MKCQHEGCSEEDAVPCFLPENQTEQPDDCEFEVRAELGEFNEDE